MARVQRGNPLNPKDRSFGLAHYVFQIHEFIKIFITTRVRITIGHKYDENSGFGRDLGVWMVGQIIALRPHVTLARMAVFKVILFLSAIEAKNLINLARNGQGSKG